jgi:hypothetical protein
VDRYKLYFARDVVKEPQMTFFADAVMKRFPEAQFVFVVRDPRSTIRSWLNHRQLPGHIEKLGAIRNRLPRLYRASLDADVWGVPEENYVGILAERWSRAAEAYLRHHDQMVLVRYEDFVKDKVGTVQRLAEQLGVEEEQSIEDRVNIQYQPRGNRSIPWEEFFSAQNLARIEDRCAASHMVSFGYEVE